ncbi:MAG: hypothetical protein HYY01_04950 [Chloroflexi bacterium]|nr:hypothetical protein [Chloroflexota bacterium]
MATGLSNQCTKQVGEHLVAAELARQGFLVATFAGNVPEFDIVAVKDSKRAVIQVKTAAKEAPNWLLNPRKFLKIGFDGEAQHLEGLQEKPPYDDIIYVFVKLGDVRGQDELYMLRWGELQEVVRGAYFHEGPVRRRPEKPGSFHFAVWPKQLTAYLVDPKSELPV